MTYKCKILADSISVADVRLTTFEITYPRFVHAELMTHRMFSRNAASSRAIPIKKMIQDVIDDPAMPVYWGKNQAGMQAAEELTGHELATAKWEWVTARDNAIAHVERLMQDGVHKQIVNRLLEPWMWITVIVSATDWDNFWHLRCHPDAQPEIQKIAYMMRDVYEANTPVGSFVHLPLIFPEDNISDISVAQMVSVGRCARVSYLTHDGKRDIQADIDLCDRLQKSGHWSPFEHVAHSTDDTKYYGNFRGWMQYRKEFTNENYYLD